MVSLLVLIIQNLSTLRIEAPEWHSMKAKSTKDDDEDTNEYDFTNYKEEKGIGKQS